ncbi:hypothetical protein M0804_015491 [Polistes exclamans]|nr:hypothetical protein M0804_015491 [Polistes exclamans]
MLYDYEIIYKPGRINSNADALSKNPVASIKPIVPWEVSGRVTKIMHQYGFKRGHGLGKNSDGITTPIQLKHPYNTRSKNNTIPNTRNIKKQKPLTASKRRKLSEKLKLIRKTAKPSQATGPRSPKISKNLSESSPEPSPS